MKTKSLVVSMIVFLLMIIFADTVFAASSNNAVGGVKLDIHHVLLQSENGENVQVKEVLKVNNTSNQAFSGSDKSGGSKEVLKISLPQGYSNLQVDGISQNAIIKNSDGIVTTSPLSPGTTQISLNYELPYNNDTISFSKVINYPTDVLYVLSPKGQLRIKGDDRIQDYGLQSMENSIYHVFVLDHPTPGQEFSLKIDVDRVYQGYQEPKSGFHSASHLQRWSSSPLKNTNPHYWVAGIIIVFVVLVTAVGRHLKLKYKIQKYREKQEHLDGLLDELVIRQKNLLDKIVLLDEKHDAGNVNAEDYRVQRELYLNKLVKLKLKIKELEAMESIGN